MSRTNNIRTAKQRISENRANSIGTYERHVAEVAEKIPEFREIDRQLSLTGLKIMQASIANPNNEAAVEMVHAEYDALVERKRQLLIAWGYPENYCDVNYICPKCADTGYVGVDICECLRRELVKVSLETSGLYSLVETQSFQTFSLDYYEKDDKINMRHQATQLWEYARNFIPGQAKSFLFLGATGLGKTHLSSAVARVVIEKGAYVVYESSITLLANYEARRFGGSSYSDDTEGDLNRYTDCDLLIIDDLGCEITNNFTISCLYNLINTRIVRHKATIINTNLKENDLRSRYTDRIFSRIMGEFTILHFQGLDIREQKLKRK